MATCYHKRFVVLIEPASVIIKWNVLGHVRVHYLWLKKFLPIVCSPSLQRVPFVSNTCLCFISRRKLFFKCRKMLIERVTHKIQWACNQLTCSLTLFSIYLQFDKKDLSEDITFAMRNRQEWFNEKMAAVSPEIVSYFFASNALLAIRGGV